MGAKMTCYSFMRPSNTARLLINLLQLLAIPIEVRDVEQIRVQIDQMFQSEKLARFYENVLRGLWGK